MANDSKVVPVPVLRRMPAYLSFVKTLQKQGEKYVSSTRIAEYMEIDATQVTKDLSHTGISGKTRVGYEVDNFVEILDDFLGFNKINNAFLVGAGSLGCALLQDKGLRNFGLNIQKAFDVDKSKIGTKINDVVRVKGGRTFSGIGSVGLQLRRKLWNFGVGADIGVTEGGKSETGLSVNVKRSFGKEGTHPETPLSGKIVPSRLESIHYGKKDQYSRCDRFHRPLSS